MMKISTLILKTILFLVLISVMPLAQGQQTEVEYEGTVVYEGLLDDGAFGPYPIGFDFTYYGNTYSDFYVTSNGLVMFDTISTSWDNVTIPTPDVPLGDTVNNYIAPFWDDIALNEEGFIQFKSVGAYGHRKLIIQFRNMYFYGTPYLLGTFQVILYEDDNSIQIQYRDIIDHSTDLTSGSSATVGIENVDGSMGILCSYNTAGYVYSGRAIHFVPGGGTYTYNENALYDPVILTDSIPAPGSVDMITPAYGSTVGQDVSFEWEAAAHASTYNVVISTNANLSSPVHTSADLTALSYDYTLTPGVTYYWTVIPTNGDGYSTWSEIWTFTTSSTPPLTAVPRTYNLVQGNQQIVPLGYTGGDTGPKTATITGLPVQGALYQNNNGVPGTQITTVPTDVTDASFQVIYSASGSTGNSAGTFDFHFSDGTGPSTDDSVTIHVSPVASPNFLEACYETNRLELIFDRKMSDPSGLHTQFAVMGNEVTATPTSIDFKDGDSSTYVLYFTPSFDIDVTTMWVSYTQGTITSADGGILQSFAFQQAIKQAQNMVFAPLADRTYGEAPFTLSATTDFGFAVSYSSEDPLIVSIAGSTATIVNAGETTIWAYQEGNDSVQPVRYAQPQRVNQATATVTLTNLNQEYTGSGIAATVTTNPLGLDVLVTYDGSETLPVDLGTYTVVAVVTDPNYIGSATDQLVITDLSVPVPDVDPLPDLTEECSLTPTAPTAHDGYGGLITGTTTTPFPITAQGTTVIVWTYDDGNGNIVTQNQNIILDDVTDPVTPVLADLTGECSVTGITAPTTTDNCAGTITGTTTDPLSYITQGSFVINWTFDDGNGNSIIVQQNVIVDDVTDPVTPVLADLTGECSVTAVAPATTDNCAGTITGTTTDPLTYNSQGSFVINWTFNDGNGNSIIVPQNVLVADVTDPVTPVLADLTDECSVTAVAPTTTDNCAGTVTGTTTDPLTYNSQGSFVIHWTFDDGNGNSIVVPQNVIVDDVTDPVTPVMADVTGECSATVAAPTTTDNCAGTILGTTTDPTTYSTEGVYLVHWTFDDGNGNSIQVTQNVIVDDVTDPVTPVLPDLSGECSVTATVPTTTDACAGLINGTTTDPLSYSTQGSYVINWTFSDGNGNSIIVPQNVYVDDVTDPVTPVLADLTGECSVTAVAPTTTDNCAGTITGTTTDPLTYNTQGSYVINWTFSDGNGNSIVVAQDVIVSDVTDPVTPVLPDLSGQCSVTASVPTTTDNCAGTVSGTTTDPLTYDTQGSYVITWTFDDGNGNSIDVDQNVLVMDDTDPVVPTLADVTGECMATATIPTTTDNCAGTITGSTTDALTYSTQGTHVITWTFDDGNGNRIDVTQNVVVDDVTAPTATKPADVSTCDGTVTGIGLTAITDNCTTPTVSYILAGATTGTGSGADASAVVFNPGVTTVTYTVDDGNGNSTQYVVTVTYDVVEDIVVTVSGGTLTCGNSGTYQWINCADNSIITGATGSSFVPDQDGDYAVILTQGSCSDTSDCYSPDYTGIGDLSSQDYTIYPNPAHAYVTLEMAREQTNVTIKVIDMTGQIVQVMEMDRLIQTDLDISEFKPGVYMIQILSDQVSSVSRIMKE